MARHASILVSSAALAVAACGSNVDRHSTAALGQDDRIQGANAAATPADVAALGLSEAQLLDADLVAVDGTDLGDVEQINRNKDAKVTSLVIEIEGSSPDRFVILPIDGLTVRKYGGDTDLQTSMAPEQLASLPQAQHANN